jgi:hypothetical protein
MGVMSISTNDGQRRKTMAQPKTRDGTRNEPLKRCIEAAGSVAELARAAGVTRSAASRWKHVPEQHVDAVSKRTLLSKAYLRPDLFA